MQSQDRKRLSGLCLGLVLLLSGCASKPASGYGADLAKSTAQQAQEQMLSAEQSTKVDTAQTYLDLIAQMQQAGQWYAALAHTDAFEQKHGASTSSQLLRADALRNTGQTEQAQSLYQSLLTGTNAARAHRGLGLLYASQQQFEKAVQHLELARQLNPIDATVLSDLAYAHMLNGYLNVAQLPAMQAAQLAPANPRVQLNLALYLLAVDKPDEAHQVLTPLTQATGKAQTPLIDQASIAALQAQVNSIKQAARLRAQALAQTTPAIPPSTTAPALPTSINANTSAASPAARIPNTPL